MNNLVSVVIPTHNRANLITDALDSVWAQSYRPIELIVVDDGSTDRTREIVEAWFAEHQRPDCHGFYVHQENQGGNVARNTGIRSANGELVAFLDSDDAWLPEKLERQCRLFSSPEVVAVYCGVRHMDFETGQVIEPTGRKYPTGSLLKQLLIRDVTVQTSAYVVRKSTFDAVGPFDVDLQARQDWDMWIRVATAGRIECVPDALVNFREHEGERTASNPLKEIDGYRKIREKYAAQLAAAPIACQLQAKSAYLKRMGRVYSKHDSLSSAAGLLYALRAIITWPFDFDAYAACVGMLLPRNFRGSLHRLWNRVFSKTAFAIRSH